MRAFSRPTGILLLTLFLCLAALGWSPSPAGAAAMAVVSAKGTAMSFQPLVAFEKLELRVAGPEGFFLETSFSPTQTAKVDLSAAWGATLPDGGYSYELKALFSGGAASSPALQSGGFNLIDGSFHADSTGPEPTLGILDQVIADDLIIQGSQCVGFDCVTNEDFGYITLRLKENNTRIEFRDTSNSGSFPNMDWIIQANDSASGGLNYLSIAESDKNYTPFTIEGGSRANALYIKGDNVGIGTNTPTANLHVAGTALVATDLQVSGNALVTGNLELSSSREIKSDIRPMEEGEAQSLLAALEPVTFRYKADPSAEHKGFIAEETPASLAGTGGKAVRPMEIISVLTRVVQSQEQTISELKAEVAELKARLVVK